MTTIDVRPFPRRHNGPGGDDLRTMLRDVGSSGMEEFIASVIPAQLRTPAALNLPPAASEFEALAELREIAGTNKMYRSLIGLGYHEAIVPPVIQRNVLENPGWYTQYTPYQAEISQGRLEALLNFQTLVSDLTGMPVANASLLDEATAAAEAMGMFFGLAGRPEGGTFFVADTCHPQTVSVVNTRARWLGINVVVGNADRFAFGPGVFGALVQYPATDGAVLDYAPFCRRAHDAGVLVAVAADLLSLTLLTPPGEFGADCVLGNSQRFGIPLGYGGPHAAFFATKDEHKRHMPGRIIGVSVDARGTPALRMALQTREQHIRREKATSNICTAQVLLAVMAGFYAVYHGPEGLRGIAERIHGLARQLAAGLRQLGYTPLHDDFFDTVRVPCDRARKQGIETALRSEMINVRWYDDCSFSISLDEVSDEREVETLLRAAARNRPGGGAAAAPTLPANGGAGYEGAMRRTTPFLTHPVFHVHHSETAMMRYIKSLEEKDLSLTFSMIPLGSCTMKLNAAAELYPVSWREFSNIHPFAPVEQTAGYQKLFEQLEGMLKEITGFAAVSFQPNSGAQGEYTGLLVIRAFHASRGQGHRNVCLIPSSAHGTNPASAVMAGMHVVVVKATADGSIDIADLEAKANEHAANLAAFMVTYPSTHGVFEEGIKRICEIIHANGGQVYMDGANLNAQLGLCRPVELGADVCHLNLHKTFCIPHGGGGPGMGPIGVARHLVPFLPAVPTSAAQQSIGSVSAAPWGSPSILVISWMYIRMMGGEGLTDATRIAILNANYMARKLEKHYPIVYKGQNGRVAHEFLLDLRQVKGSAGIEVEDVAKRLMDYGFHAPTTSFPVVGTLMIEPTESEGKAELDRFCEALIRIRQEIAEIESGAADRENNVLKNAPHTAETVVSDAWPYPYPREKAAYPGPWTRARKFWPPVGRVNSAYGDKNLVCTCPPVEAYAGS